MRRSTQVLVVGGGPAGSTAAGLLAREGFDVTLFEREHFPRYHIGESILPSCRPILEILGAWEKVEAHGFTGKEGSYFFWGDDEWEVRFNRPGDGPNAWQVIRSEFDQLLLEHARSLGVHVVEGISVRDLEFDGARPVAAEWTLTDAPGAEGGISFDFLVDASGRTGVMSRHRPTRRFHDVFKNVAVWSYWQGARRLDKGPEGAIAVCSIRDGWFWAIPLHDGTLSVGLVINRSAFNSRRGVLGSVDAVYHDALRQCAPVLELIEGATQTTGIKVETDYSYTSDRFGGPGFVLCGDSACFLDPLLSTGVHLAMYAALLGAASVGSMLRGDVSEEEGLRFYDRAYRRAYERLLVLVSVFYETHRGKDYHFANAHRLTRRQRDDEHIKAAFDRIVSGIEDLDDAQEAYALVMDRLVGQDAADPNPLANVNLVHEEEQRQSPFTPANAVDGLYIGLRPRLGLRRVSDLLGVLGARRSRA